MQFISLSSGQVFFAGIETPPEVSIEGREFESSQEKVNTLGYETPPNIPHSYENLTKSLPTFTTGEI